MTRAHLTIQDRYIFILEISDVLRSPKPLPFNARATIARQATISVMQRLNHDEKENHASRPLSNHRVAYTLLALHLGHVRPLTCTFLQIRAQATVDAVHVTH